MVTNEERELRRKVTGTLFAVRLRIEQKGFHYLREMLEWKLSRESGRVSLKEACRIVALRHNVTVEKVEAAIQHSIKSDYELRDRLNELYGREVVRENPTPKVAIAYLLEYLRLYCEEA